jgi:hypothetical protein
MFAGGESVAEARVLDNLWPQLFWADWLVASVSTTDLAGGGHGIRLAVVGHVWARGCTTFVSLATAAAAALLVP